jgi:hypothetical protein
MPTPTYVALATTTLNATAASLTFSSIPTSGYRDLILVYNGTTSANIGVDVEFNGDTTSANYSRVFMYAPPVSSTTGGPQEIFYSSTARTVVTCQIQDSSATDKHKTLLSRMGAVDVIVGASALRWANTNAITSLKLTPKSGNTFSSASTFSLFGIEA